MSMLTRLNNNYLREMAIKDKLALFLMAIFYGCYFFTLNLLAYSPDGFSEAEEFLIFISGWLTVPLFSLLAAGVTLKVKQRFYSDKELFFPLLVASNLLFWFAAVAFKEIDMSAPCYLLLLALEYPLINLLLILLLQKFNFKLNADSFADLVYLLTPIFVLASLAYFGTGALPGISSLIGAVLFGLGGSYYAASADYSFKKPLALFLDIVVLSIMVLLVINMDFPYNQHHQNFYLGPVNDVLRGKTMLLDVVCQYGALVIYFLALLFKTGLAPLSYQGLTLITMVLALVEYLCFYWLLRYLLKSWTLPIVAIIFILQMNYFATMATFVECPSIGPLRFFLPYLLLLSVMLQDKYQRYARVSVYGEYLVLAVASLWSLETFIYTATTYLALLLVESAGISFIKTFCRRAAGAVLFMGIAHLLFAVLTYWRAGEWPNWLYYLAYLRAYSTGGFGTLPLYFWGPWVLFIGVYFASLAAIVFQLFQKSPQEKQRKIILAITFMGIAQFTYFLGRSHPNGLFHICVPAILVAFYWLDWLAHQPVVPKVFLLSAAFCFYYVAGELVLANARQFWSKAPSTGGYALARTISELARGEPLTIKQQFKTLRENKATDEKIDKITPLIMKYVSNKRAIALFISPELTTETLLRLRKTNAFPIANPIEDNILLSNKERILSLPHNLKAGDFIFFENNLGELLPIQMYAIDRLYREFDFWGVESQGEIIAVKLVQKSPGSGNRSNINMRMALLKYKPMGFTIKYTYRWWADRVLSYTYVD